MVIARTEFPKPWIQKHASYRLGNNFDYLTFGISNDGRTIYYQKADREFHGLKPIPETLNDYLAFGYIKSRYGEFGSSLVCSRICLHPKMRMAPSPYEHAFRPEVPSHFAYEALLTKYARNSKRFLEDNSHRHGYFFRQSSSYAFPKLLEAFNLKLDFNPPERYERYRD